MHRIQADKLGYTMKIIESYIFIESFFLFLSLCFCSGSWTDVSLCASVSMFQMSLMEAA